MFIKSLGWLGGTILVARRTNDWKVAGSRPTKVVCITVLTGNRMGVNFRAVGSWSLDCQR